MLDLIVKYKKPLLLIIGILLVLGLGIGLIVWFTRRPSKPKTTTTTTAESPTVGASDVNTLKQLEKDIAELESNINRAKEIFTQGAPSE